MWQKVAKFKGAEYFRKALYINSSWCTIFTEVSRFCSPEVDYLMISCRPHYLPREFSSLFFVAVYIPPQTEAGTKTALNEMHTAISKQENAHPEAALLVAGDFNAGKLLHQFYLISISMLNVLPDGENSRTPLLHTETHTKLSIWQI